ncbi:hypothetical protein SO694_0000264 [Aureococcus anophagefferens]|uniref:EamA domain-containing protein n=1 Tax=Aureococcus anophagefferens TaxID=44056 RepID=A0ABR1GD39_AURAN
MSAAGYLAAVGSAALNGSWPAIIKSRRVVEARLPPLLLNVSFIFGFAVVAVVVVAFEGYLHWTNWGLLSGAILTVASGLTLGVAIPNAGVAIPSGIAAACYLVTAYVWSAYILDQGMRSVALSLVGILVVICGLALVVSASLVKKAPPDQAEATLLPDDDDKDERLVPDEANLPLGLVASAVVGVLGGSNMAPEEYARDDAQGIHYVPSFALSALLWSSLAALAAHRAGAPAALASGRAAVCPAMCAGAIYGSSICCYVAAVVALDYSVASTLSQCSMLVTGAWGILLYDELGGDARRLALYVTGASVVVAGAGVVSYYGTTE